MKKATHNGTCQVCGREQALPYGKLSKHGYDVPFHYFRGTCPGAEFLPLEQSREQADNVAAGLMVTSRSKAQDAIAVERGEMLPRQADFGFRCMSRDGGWQDVAGPFADAPEHQQRQAVRALHWALAQESKECARISEAIVARANAITGKRELKSRDPEAARKVIAAGSRFKLGGVERVALRVEERMARGVGPYLNGNYMPHVVFLNDAGKEFAYPVRLIRQAAIL
jgi:hypothetical protein